MKHLREVNFIVLSSADTLATKRSHHKIQGQPAQHLRPALGGLPPCLPLPFGMCKSSAGGRVTVFFFRLPLPVTELNNTEPNRLARTDAVGINLTRACASLRLSLQRWAFCWMGSFPPCQVP